MATKRARAKPTPDAAAARSPDGRTLHVREHFGRAGEGFELRDQIFDRCLFERSNTPRPPESPHYARAERLDFIDCAVKAQRGFSRVECHEILVRGVPKKSARILAWEFLLDRVTFEGDIHADWTFFWVHDHLKPDEMDYVRAFYDRLPSFALDIRRARFRGLSLRGVPGHLVLRDPATTALFHRDRLEADRSWCKLDEWGRADAGISGALDLFLKTEPRWPSFVIVAGMLGRHPERDLAELEPLKRAGFAD